MDGDDGSGPALEHQRDRATEPHEEIDIEALLGPRFAGKD